MLYLRRLRDLREDNDLAQKRLSALLGVHQATYSDYENGVVRIPVEHLMTLADFYGVSVDYLLGRTDQRAPYPGRAR